MSELKNKEKDEVKEHTCEDCGNKFYEENLRRYKYEKSIWVCDDCCDRRIDE